MTAKMFTGTIPTALISLPTNDTWKRHRRIVGTAMTSKYLSLTTPRANEPIKEVIELWRLKGETDMEFEAHQDLSNGTMVSSSEKEKKLMSGCDMYVTTCRGSS